MGETWWASLQQLFSFANQSPLCLDGECSCFDLKIDRASAVFCSEDVLVRATILQHLQTVLDSGDVVPVQVDHPCRKAVLRLRSADWATLGAHCDFIRALWTQVRVSGEVVILDTTVGAAFLAGDVCLRDDTTLQIAEIFCGGFAGWTQAAWQVHATGHPVRAAWLLDLEDAVQAPLEHLIPDLSTVASASELQACADHTSPLLLLANFEHTWWHRVWASMPPDIVAASPPCQPWSSAGSQSGLSSPDGRLILLLISVLQVVRIPVVCLEEVPGFCQHQDFPVIMSAWEASGYTCVYREEVQLAEVAPTWRKRCLMIFVHKVRLPEATSVLTAQHWWPVGRPSLFGLRAYFKVLPADILRHCVIAEDVLQQYLDPWFLPPGVPHCGEAARKFRLCTPSQQARTFMAAYHRQHLLPPGMLEKRGLLCSLLQVNDTIRYFAAPEIASCHGAQRQHLFVKDDAMCMQILGNGLAVHQAALALAHAVKCFPGYADVSPAAVVQKVVAERLTSVNSALFRLPTGWLLVRFDLVGVALASDSLRHRIEARMCSRGQVFHALQLGEGANARDFQVVQVLRFSSHLTVRDACQALELPSGVPPSVVEGSQGRVFRVTVAELPRADFHVGHNHQQRCGCVHRVYTAAGQFLLQPSVPDFFHQLKFVFDQVEACRVCTKDDGLLLCIDPECAFEWAMQAQPCAEGACAAIETIRQYLRDLLFLAQFVDATPAQVGPFVLQVGTRTLRVAKLPADLTPRLLEAAWRRASAATGCWPGAQAFSGPRRLPFEATLISLTAQGAFHKQASADLPVITIHPECRGGGVKDENLQLAKTKLGTLLIERGVTLSQANVAVDSFVAAVGATASLASLSLPNPVDRWQKLCAQARSVGQTERAAQRIQKAVRRRRLSSSKPVVAADFQLIEGTWCGIDDSPVPVLDTITSESSGVILMDPGQANPQDIGLLCNLGAEALCVVVPGFDCPDPETCSGRASTPVLRRATGGKHLIAVCYHNLGDTAISPFVQHGSQVEISGVVCCTFCMHRDECPSTEMWHETVQAPVRSVAQLFKAKGVQSPFSHPWGRSYRSAGRPSQALHCDVFQFQAKVEEDVLAPLLKQSGFNRVYVTPRGWNREVLQGWSVIWLSSSKHDLERQAALLPEQHGLVRGKSRFGIRVPTSSFARLFQQLRPGDAVPESFDVKALFKVGPIPPGATADTVLQWARKLHWQIRVIKTLGPSFWLVGSPGAPPSETLTFNQQPVLVSPVKGREVHQAVVQAGGPLPSRRQGATTPVDPWLSSDPWSAYLAAKTDGQHPPGPSMPVAPLPPSRTVDPQVQSQLHAQEHRLNELEQHLRGLREGQVAADHERAADKQQLQQEIAGVRGEVQCLGAGLQQQLQAQLDSLGAAQRSQEQQMNAGLNDLKQLILSQTDQRKARRLPGAESEL
ncbi:unnamed protein product [Symbiodinium necroappetens]|uniref:Uncharacterized protein n=1 Tax=Symbiodinium necroappetens TaxID=1628268 RepID=A0A812LEP2_9DINO|nr:unnamed protein product [Symbiodinium necroappetens]